MSDFFDTHEGTAPRFRSKLAWSYRLRDRVLDLGIRLGGGLAALRKRDATPAARILVVGVEVPSRAADVHQVMRALQAGSRHRIVTSIAPMEARGKFANIDAAIEMAGEPLDQFDWLVITDDDISFSPTFLDDLLLLATAADLAIAQPAHAIESFTTYTITKRRSRSLVRRTDFVEIGPLTLVRADAFAAFIPFPPSRWCYGIDILWSEIAARHGFRMGIVDGTPIRHLRPVGASYSMDDAIVEGRELLGRFDLKLNRSELFARDEIVVPTTVR